MDTPSNEVAKEQIMSKKGKFHFKSIAAPFSYRIGGGHETDQTETLPFRTHLVNTYTS